MGAVTVWKLLALPTAAEDSLLGQVLNLQHVNDLQQHIDQLLIERWNSHCRRKARDGREE
jgi:hypothetical protein